MTDLLATNPLLLLFAVIAAGYLVGQVSVRGSRLGAAAVLFAGLAAGACDERLQLPEILQSFGLTLFVYTIGLQCGPAFVASLRGDGWRLIAFAVAVVALAGVEAVALAKWFSFDAPLAAGLFAGSLTNTPALAAASELMPGKAAGAAAAVAYAITYPLGVVAVMAVMTLLRRGPSRSPADPSGETSAHRLVGRTVRVTTQAAVDRSIATILDAARLDVVVGRILSRGRLATAHMSDRLRKGDLVSVVGSAASVARAAAVLGEESELQLADDRSHLDYRRILVSDARLAGRALADLRLAASFGAVITRLRRGDTDHLPRPDTVLELGDRVRVVAARTDLDAISRFFGDSERVVSEVDDLSLGIGIALGLALGLLVIPLPGGLSLRLGLAGGPLVVALVLGARARTGPILWSLPHGATLTLRQLGLVLFLATVGTRAGRPFVETLADGGLGWRLLLAGALMTTSTAVVTLLLGRRWLRPAPDFLAGLAAGVQTQPALLAFAQERGDADDAGAGYAAAFPAAFIAKVLAAQLVYLASV